jgi:S-DNA-T family DNA segregation ATPase FtsK/SpoIIIE
VHVAVGGSSGWGKSVFLRSLAYQLAQSAEPVSLVMIDLEGTTLAPFSRCDRLLWPVADDEDGALAILSELTTELDRRKALFAQYPGIDSLSAYNVQADDPLSPCVCLIDEATALLGDKDVEGALRTLALRARKYGLWLVLAGQDWKATSLDTAIRNQLGARVQFKSMSASQSRVLLQRAGAEDLDAKGRALAWLPGRELTEVQTPWLSREDILAALTGQGPRLAMPEVPEGERDEMIRDLADEGLSRRRIQETVFGYVGGQAHVEVTRVLGPVE